MKKNFICFLALTSISAFANNPFECEKSVVKKYAIIAAEESLGIKLTGVIKVGTQPYEAGKSFERWLVSVKADDAEQHLLLPLDKKIDEDGNIVCGWH